VIDAAPAISTTLYHNLNFVFLRDIAPVACVISTPRGQHQAALTRDPTDIPYCDYFPRLLRPRRERSNRVNLVALGALLPSVQTTAIMVGAERLFARQSPACARRNVAAACGVIRCFAIEAEEGLP
jgi:hypothetical protein